MTGYGGNVVLCNSTPYTWALTAQHSYQMNAWSFPASIAPGTCPSIYVEYNTGAVTASDDGGEAEYTVQGGDKFEVQARASQSGITTNLWLQIWYESLITNSHTTGDTSNIGFRHNDQVIFDLSGSHGSYSDNL